MVSKTERFEMRLDEETILRIDNWRETQSDQPSRAEAIRRLVESGLAAQAGETVRFSDGEKLLLLLMRDLLKHLKVTRAETDVEFISQVIFGGHYWAPKWRMPGVFHGHEDKPANLRVVLDVLEMWDSIERGYDKLSKADRELVAQEAPPFGKRVRFPGFDGNNEAEYGVIADFLIEKMERFPRFADRDLNPHMPMLPMYERMLSLYKRSRSFEENLGVDKIIALLKAMPAPR